MIAKFWNNRRNSRLTRFSGQDEGESIVFVSSLQPSDIPGVSRWRDQEGALGSKITRARLPGSGWLDFRGRDKTTEIC